MNSAVVHIAPPDQSSSPPFPSAAAAAASSANDARRPVAASQGRRSAHEGSCPCGTDTAGALSPGNLVHHHPDCAIFRVITATRELREQTIACAVLDIQSLLRLYQNVVELHAADLSMRQTYFNLANLRESLDAIESHFHEMRNDMPLVLQRRGRKPKGATRS